MIRRKYQIDANPEALALFCAMVAVGTTGRKLIESVRLNATEERYYVVLRANRRVHVAMHLRFPHSSGMTNG